jgi:hypothetical protein
VFDELGSSTNWSFLEFDELGFDELGFDEWRLHQKQIAKTQP